MLCPGVSGRRCASHTAEAFTTERWVHGAGRPWTAARLGCWQPEATSQNPLAPLGARIMSRVPATRVRGTPGSCL